MKKIFPLLLFIITHLTYGQQINIASIPNSSFQKYELTHIDDTITFYLTTTDKTEDLPLVVYINGSGWSSVFQDHQGQIRSTAGQTSWSKIANNRFRILVIEKPGTQYLKQEESIKFQKNYSLQSRCETIKQAIEYVVTNNNIDKSKILLAGHSEGGIVAAKIANDLQAQISHVAIIAGEGPSQLFSLYKFAEEGTFFNSDEYTSSTTAERIALLTNVWKDIEADPTNTDKKFMGLTFLRWSSMLSTSVIDELKTYDGNILIVQGTTDTAVHPESAKIAYASLLSKGKTVDLKMIDEADHSFNLSNHPQIDGWKMMIEMTYQWFITK